MVTMTAIGDLDRVYFETAGEHLTDRVPTAGPDDLAGQVRASLSGHRFDTASAVAVTEAGRLVGLVRMEDLLAASSAAPLRDVMDPEPAVVGRGVDQEVAAWHAVQRGESVLTVVDEAGRFLGFVPPDRMLAVLLWEHDEDMARLGGFLHDARTARRASQEPVVRRLWHRLPWLVVGLAGALAAALLIESFEAELSANVALAYFIPGIVYMADAVGTQTETLLIRGLSVGVRIGEIVRREIITGLLVGAVVAGLFFPVALWLWDAAVATAAALALLAACSIATLVAMVLPWALNRLGKDPAFGSGPLATVIQDLASIVIYFGIVLLVVY
jgi:magnesium transporter